MPKADLRDHAPRLGAVRGLDHLATLADPGRSLCWVAPVAEESELAAEDPLALSSGGSGSGRWRRCRAAMAPCRGGWDAMRGVRGALAAWRPWSGALPRDFPLISRQQELGNLGAYLSPLRRAGLVIDGTLRPSPAALDVIDSF